MELPIKRIKLLEKLILKQSICNYHEKLHPSIKFGAEDIEKKYQVLENSLIIRVLKKNVFL